VASAPVLEAPNFDLGLELATDASSYGLGAVLQQRHPNGDVHPISFASRLLTPAEKRYITQEQECLAVVFDILKFEVYLRGRQFAVVTDHQGILNVRTCSSPSSRVLR
jgi:hypothetical protein